MYTLIFQFPIYLEPGADRYLIYVGTGSDWFQTCGELEDVNWFASLGSPQKNNKHNGSLSPWEVSKKNFPECTESSGRTPVPSSVLAPWHQWVNIPRVKDTTVDGSTSAYRY